MKGKIVIMTHINNLFGGLSAQLADFLFNMQEERWQDAQFYCQEECHLKEIRLRIMGIKAVDKKLLISFLIHRGELSGVELQLKFALSRTKSITGIINLISEDCEIPEILEG